MMWVLALATAFGADLGVLERNFDRFPEDYATAMALGEAALAAGEADVALLAFERAVGLSKGNFESRRGQVLAQSLAGEHVAAIAAGNALVADFPDRPDAHAARAWVWRWQPVLPQLSAVMASRGYTRALSLGGGGDLACGLGWTRWGLGDAFGARHAFDATDAACAESGRRATPRGVWMTGAALGGATGFTDHAWRQTSNTLGAQVGASWSSLVGVDATVRRVGVTGETDTLDPLQPPGVPPAEALTLSAQQSELWLRARTRGRRFGGEGLFGILSATGDLEQSGTFFGARGWAQLAPVTVGLSGVSATYDDADHLQLGIDLDLPLTPTVALSGGVQNTRLTTTETATMGWGAVRYQSPDDRFQAQLGARFGSELRPVRMAEPSVWNLDDTVRQSAFATLSWRIDDRFTLFSGAERLRLEGTSSTNPVLASESTATTGHVGLRVDLGPVPREDR